MPACGFIAMGGRATQQIGKKEKQVNVNIPNEQLTWQQAEAKGVALTLEQRAAKMAYQAAIPTPIVLLLLKLEERVAALESKAAQQ